MFILENLTKIYSTQNGNVAGIENFNLELPDKGLIFVMGESGSGKTTLMNVLAGLDEETSGKILFNDEVVTNYNEKQWDIFRNRYIGIVFQNFNLIDDMNVFDNLALPLKILKTDKNQISNEVERVLEYVGLSKYEKRKVYELSAGQKQRIAIARAIIKNPDIILADEVTGNLDPNNSKEIFDLLDKISKRCLVIAITHDKASAYQYGDRIITIADALLVSDEDNRKAKEISGLQYNIMLSDSVNHVEYCQKKQLGEFDIKSEILKSLKLNPNQKEVKYTLSIKMNEETDSKKDLFPWKSNHRIKNLSLTEVIKMAAGNLAKRKARLAMTSLLFLFTCTLLFMSIIIGNNDYIRSFSNYLKTKDLTNVGITRNAAYTDGLGNENETQLYKGKQFLKDVKSIVEQKDIIECMKDCDVGYTNLDGEAKFCTTNFIINNNSDFFKTLEIDGVLPVNADEIVLDYNTAEKLGISSDKLKQKVTVYEDSFIVTGILHSKIREEDTYSIFSDKLIQMKVEKEESLSLNATNLVQSKSTRNYVNTSARIGSVNWLTAKNNTFQLIYGEVPKNKNEFLISADLAEEIGWDGTDNFVTMYRLPDLYQKKYNGMYDDKINMYDYTGKQVNVVGIFQTELADDTKQADILMQDEMYLKLKADYYETLFSDEYFINIKDYEEYEIVKEFISAGYRVNAGVSMYIYIFIDVTAKLKKGLHVAVLISMIMTIIMMMSYIVYNIRDHARKIGILRAIGVGSKDIIRMFLVETSTISSMVVLFSVVLSSLLVRMVNAKINQITFTDTLHMLTINYFLIVILSGTIFIVSVILTMIPVMWLMHLKSIHLLNDNLEEN